jgi:hypothetical protein
MALGSRADVRLVEPIPAAAYSLRKAGRHPRGISVARMCAHLLERSIDHAADEVLRSFGLSIRSFHNVLAADPAALDVVHIHVPGFHSPLLYPVMAIQACPERNRQMELGASSQSRSGRGDRLAVPPRQQCAGCPTQASFPWVGRWEVYSARNFLRGSPSINPLPVGSRGSRCSRRCTPPQSSPPGFRRKRRYPGRSLCLPPDRRLW